MNANDRQVGGVHYKVNPGEPEHWDLAVLYNWDYFQGQVTKYLMRWKKKGGLDDLLKAQHFLEKYIEAVRAGNYTADSIVIHQCEFCGERSIGRNLQEALEAHGECASPAYVNQDR